MKYMVHNRNHQKDTIKVTVNPQLFLGYYQIVSLILPLDRVENVSHHGANKQGMEKSFSAFHNVTLLKHNTHGCMGSCAQKFQSAFNKINSISSFQPYAGYFLGQKLEFYRQKTKVSRLLYL